MSSPMIRWLAATTLVVALALAVGWRWPLGDARTSVAATPADAACAPAPSPSTSMGTPAAGHAGHDQTHDQATDEPSPYAERFDPTAAIRALTPDEIGQIQRGEGAGFALPAELNGVPGPRHVLDLAAELGLAADQRTEVQAEFDAMRAAVLPAGERYLAAQQALEEAFRCGTLTEEALPDRVIEVNRLRGEFAALHLAAHLKTAKLLTPEQIDAYNRVRGYR